MKLGLVALLWGAAAAFSTSPKGGTGPERESRTAGWPGWVEPGLRDRLVARGVRAPWQHRCARP